MLVIKKNEARKIVYFTNIKDFTHKFRRFRVFEQPLLFAIGLHRLGIFVQCAKLLCLEYARLQQTNRNFCRNRFAVYLDLNIYLDLDFYIGLDFYSTTSYRSVLFKPGPHWS